MNKNARPGLIATAAGSALALLLVVMPARVMAAQTAYSEAFTQGTGYCTGDPQSDHWNQFLTALPASSDRITIAGSLDPTGFTCTDPAKVTDILDNLKNGNAATVQCGATYWTTGACGNGCGSNTELSVATFVPGICNCYSSGSGVATLRPSIQPGNPNWGGFGDTCFAPTQTLSLRVGNPDVGYYEMSAGSGSGSQVQPIADAGFVPVLLTDVDAASLASVQVLFVNNSSNGGYAAEYLSRLTDIANFVSAGGVLIIHDRYVDGAESILPNGGGFNIVRDFGDSANIDVVNNSTIITNGNGPGGTISNSSLDGGTSSSHGFTFSSSIPVSGLKILSTGDPDHIVTFVYSHGTGFVIYSSIPLDFYLGSSGTVATNMKAYAANVIAYAGSLVAGGGAAAVQDFNYLDYFNDDEEEEELADEGGGGVPPLTLAGLLAALLLVHRRRQ